MQNPLRQVVGHINEALAVSDVIDFGTTPILAGDRIWVTLPNENVDGYYRVINAEYRLLANTQTLETTLELGREPLVACRLLIRVEEQDRKLSSL